MLRRLLTRSRTVPASAEHVPASPRDAKDRVDDIAALARDGRFAESLAAADAILRDRPGDPAAHYARGLTLLDWARPREALDALLTAEAKGMRGIKLDLNIGLAFQRLGASSAAEPRFRAAIANGGDDVAGQLALGHLFMSTGRFHEAVDAFEPLATLRQVDCEASIAACCLQLKDAAAAETWARRAIERSGSADAWRLLGIALSLQDRSEECFAAYDRARALAPDPDVGMVVDFGQSLIEAGRWRDAADWYARHLAHEPDTTGLTNYGAALLALGSPDGWPTWEFRWLASQSANRSEWGVPRWRGQPLAGKSIVLWSEQGLGDTIQFIRYAGVFKRMGATVVARVQSRLKRLAAAFDGVDRAVAGGEPLGAIDFHLPMMSAPFALGGVEVAQPGTYLRVDDELARTWRSFFGAHPGLRVGLVWSGNPEHVRDRHRSIPWTLCRQLLDVPGVRFFSLQKDRRPGDDIDARVVDLAPRLNDFTDAAGAIANLDLVICVDTAVAHLAGALGKPVWMLIPAVGDFRWLTRGSRCDWYPAMRLFRQSRLGEWQAVLAEVASALDGAARNGVPTLDPPSDPRGEEPVPRANPEVSRVAETRYGIMQFRPLPRDTADALEWYGEWLQPELDVIRQLVPSGATVLDASARHGEHVVPIARHVGPAGLVFAYAADPVDRTIVAQNVAANRLTAVVQVMRGSETVDELGLARLDLLKSTAPVPCEDLLRGAEQSLWKLRPVIWLALENDGAGAPVASYLHDFGYRAWLLRTPLFNAANFNLRQDDRFGGRAAWTLVAVAEEREPVALSAAHELT